MTKLDQLKFLFFYCSAMQSNTTTTTYNMPMMDSKKAGEIRKMVQADSNSYYKEEVEDDYQFYEMPMMDPKTAREIRKKVQEDSDSYYHEVKDDYQIDNTAMRPRPRRGESRASLETWPRRGARDPSDPCSQREHSCGSPRPRRSRRLMAKKTKKPRVRFEPPKASMVPAAADTTKSRIHVCYVFLPMLVVWSFMVVLFARFGLV